MKTKAKAGSTNCAPGKKRKKLYYVTSASQGIQRSMFAIAPSKKKAKRMLRDEYALSIAAVVDAKMVPMKTGLLKQLIKESYNG